MKLLKKLIIVSTLAVAFAPLLSHSGGARLTVNQVTGFDAASNLVCTDTTTQISTSGKTPIGNMTSAGGLAAAFDGDTTQSSAETASTAAQGIGYVGIDWGAGTTHTISRIVIYGANDGNTNGGFVTSTNPSVTITIQGSNDNFSSSIDDLRSATFTDTDNESAGRDLLMSFASTPYRYHRAKIDPGASGTKTNAAELKLFGC